MGTIYIFSMDNLELHTISVDNFVEKFSVD